MAYATSEARQQLLDEVAQAIDRLAIALAAVGSAYELLDEQAGDRLEEALFRPVQVAYGRAKRTHASFAERHKLPGRDFAPASPRSGGLHEQVDDAVDAIEGADEVLSELQDSMMPVEVGDPEVRAGIAEVREALAPLPERAHELARRFGR
jgi:hypothetical protein